MINAIFDLSNMFFRSLWIVGGFGKKNYTFNTQFELDQLMRKVATDISSIIRFVNPSRVIFAVDSKSWRKNIPIDENEGYKANREKNKNINWENIYKIMGEFSQILESNGFIVSKIDGAEADDIMTLWKNELLENQKQHVILISADEDIRQLVNSENLIFSTVYNPFVMGKNSSRKLFIPNNFEDWLNDEDEGDIFNRNIDVDKEDFRRLLTSERIKIEIINGSEVAIKKVLCGDDGDNVPAIYSWINENNKEVRITDSKYIKIVEKINVKNYQDLLKKSSEVKNQLINISRVIPSFEIEDRLERQFKLVVLDPKLFPESIINIFNSRVHENLNKPFIQPQSWNMISILDGTRYVDSSRTSVGEASIFREIDRINLNKKLF